MLMPVIKAESSSSTEMLPGKVISGASLTPFIVMFTVAVEHSLIEHCKTVLAKHNFGKRYTANGTKEQQLTGIIGQSVVMNLFNIGYVDGTSGFDNGVDLVYNNKTIDVKTMGRTTRVKANYTNNFLKLQDYFKTDIYIFCSYHKINNVLTVCGWISKADFVKITLCKAFV